MLGCHTILLSGGGVGYVRMSTYLSRCGFLSLDVSAGGALVGTAPASSVASLRGKKVMYPISTIASPALPSGSCCPPLNAPLLAILNWASILAGKEVEEPGIDDVRVMSVLIFNSGLGDSDFFMNSFCLTL